MARPLETDTVVSLNEGHGKLTIPDALTVTTTADATYLILTETGRNTETFVSFDSSDISQIKLESDLENSRHTVSYADSDATLIVRDESTDISITSDDFWNSGEAATVAVTAPNLNENTRDSDDITMESDEIPTIEINSPITIVDFTSALDQETNLIAFNAPSPPATHTFVNPDLNDNVNASRTSVEGFYTTTIVAKNNTNDESLLEGIATSVTTLNIDKTEDASKLYTFNSDVATGSALTFTMDVDISAPFYLLKSYSSNSSTFELTGADGPISNDGTQEGPLSGTLTLTVTLTGDHKKGDVLVFDILSFGEVTDADGDTSVENNAIYRHLVEETDAGGVFEGTLEYVMLNQINIVDSTTYDSTETGSNELVLIIDDEYSGNDLQISYAGETAHVEVQTSGGTVSLDSDSYSTNGSVSVTLIDQDLNVDNDEVESYTLRQNGTVRGGPLGAVLLTFDVDDKLWVDCTDKDGNARGLGLPDAFTLEESSDSPGTFTAEFDIPTTYCDGTDDRLNPLRNDGQGTGTVTGKSIQVTYEDFRDDTGIETTWSDSATIQAITGTVTIDRNVYPVPSQAVEEGSVEITPQKDVVVHIEINDQDHNTNSDVLDRITGQVKVEITPVSSPSPKNINDAVGIAAFFEETTEDSGIFSDSVTIPFNVLGTDDDGDAVDPIEQSYILSVTYSDNSDATGETSDVTDSAIFNIGTATLGTDATEYTIKQKAFITLVDHDSNYDSDTRETIPLSSIDWAGSADATLDPETNDEFDASPPFLRETEANSGIFLTEITIPKFVDDNGDEAVERGESVTLTYVDTSPAGADRPGLDERDVETSFTISRTGASLTLDKDVYSWRDRVTVTVVAPDFNIDPLAVESVGNDGEVRIRSQLGSVETILTETGPNTGIFQGTEDLGGFEYNVADDVMVQPATMLKVGSEDGISVTFTYDEDERDLIQSALIRWSVAEVTWLEDSYREGATGTLRVVDPQTETSIRTRLTASRP